LLHCGLQISSKVARIELAHSSYDTDREARTVRVCEAATLCAAGVTCTCTPAPDQLCCPAGAPTGPAQHLPKRSTLVCDKHTCAAGRIKVFAKVFHEEDTAAGAHVGRVRNHSVQRVQVMLQLLAPGRARLVRTLLEHGPALDCICLAEVQHDVRLAPVSARTASLLMIACTSTPRLKLCFDSFSTRMPAEHSR
jgi:hypothetical protein